MCTKLQLGTGCAEIFPYSKMATVNNVVSISKISWKDEVFCHKGIISRLERWLSS